MTTSRTEAPPGRPPRSTFVQVDGISLHLLDWGGTGPPLVLLPGLGQSAWIYSGLAPLLAPAFRVVALTPRGHGQSGAPGRGYTVARLAEDLRGVLDALEIGRAALAAHSFGGMWGTRFAADHPERVSAMVYLDAVVDYTSWAMVQGRAPYRPPLPPHGDVAAEEEWARRYVYGFWCYALEADWRVRPTGAWRDRLASLLEDAAAHPQPYAELRAPALAVAAGESVDTLFPWLAADDVAARWRAAEYLEQVRRPWREAALQRFRREARGQVVVVPGHHAVFLDGPERVAAELRTFLLAAAEAA